MKINSILLSFLLIFGLFSSQFASAQQMQVSASIDTTAAQVGDALWLKLTAQVPAGMAVTFPRIFADSTYAAVFDSISFKMDTVRNGNQIQVSQLLQVLAEKDGNHNLPALKFLLNSGQRTDTLESFPFTIFVANQADTTKMYKPEVKPLDTPMNLKEFLERFGPLIVGGLIVLGLVIGLIYYIRKRKQAPKPLPRKAIIPPHIVALNALEKIKAEKPWIEGNLKQYYSDITDIVKKYTENRYNIAVMEMTTDETLHIFRGVPDKLPAAVSILEKILKLADMVKFAKFQTIPAENEASIEDAIRYVQTIYENDKLLKESVQTDKSNN